nr:MAG TPA: hypothetical protein [Caudoviricetes sp.]
MGLSRHPSLVQYHFNKTKKERSPERFYIALFLRLR